MQYGDAYVYGGQHSRGGIAINVERAKLESVEMPEPWTGWPAWTYWCSGLT
jgi:hypothetical protein